MPNPKKGEILFQLPDGGEAYTLRFSTNSLVELENSLDKSLDEISLSMRDPKLLRIGIVRAVFWSALRDNHKSVTLSQAGDIIDKAGLGPVVEVVSQAFALAFGDGDERDPPQPEAKANPLPA